MQKIRGSFFKCGMPTILDVLIKRLKTTCMHIFRHSYATRQVLAKGKLPAIEECIRLRNMFVCTSELQYLLRIMHKIFDTGQSNPIDGTQEILNQN